MPTLQELQKPIDSAIVSSMIESTPESWTEIVLTLVRAKPPEVVGGFTHELSSPEGHPSVGAAESLFEATYHLDQLFQARGAVFSHATYVAKASEGSWSYSVEFKYESPAL